VITGDGVIDRYMIDLPHTGGDALRLLLLQAGGGLFDADGNVTFDSDIAVDVLLPCRQIPEDHLVVWRDGEGKRVRNELDVGILNGPLVALRIEIEVNRMSIDPQEPSDS
jgi:hypothetical protein